MVDGSKSNNNEFVGSTRDMEETLGRQKEHKDSVMVEARKGKAD
jgi:hypothetical protein